MADTEYYEYRTEDGVPVRIKLTDNGDGTYSLGGGSGGAATPTAAASGELAGNVAATQLPDVPCTYAYLKARLTNAGNVYLGAAGVTKPNGTDDVTTGLELTPGDMVTLPIDNLNRLYRICDNAGDALTYLVVA